jgi:glucuronate isomerase
MPFINWSDPEEMLGLLAEYVADERLAEREDRERRRFLSELTAALTALASDAEKLSMQTTIDRLRNIYDSQAREFGADAALIHLHDCIQELERIAREASAPPN